MTQNPPLQNQSFRDIRALVVDDQMLSREILCAELAEFGVQTEQAANGAEALEKICLADKSTPFWVVFTDLRMPQISGTELISRVREANLIAAPATVLVTSHNASVLDDHPATARPDIYISKPAGRTAIFNVLLSLFSIA